MHPKCALTFDIAVSKHIANLLYHDSVIAVGETGLDAKYTYQSPLEKQTLAFVYQLQLAARHQLPLTIHQRDMHTPTLQLTIQYLHHTHKIHIHCFTETPEQADEWLQHFPNIKFGVTNLINKKGAAHITELASHLTLKQILIETDTPHFIPNGYKFASHSHPALALNVATKIAPINSTKLSTVLDITSDIAQQTYNIFF